MSYDEVGSPEHTKAIERFKKIQHEEHTRALLMPTEQDALKAMFRAWQRLHDLGWRDASYCPKDGSVFKAIEAGSTGVHDCHYDGEWPTGRWWVHAPGDLCPSRPILFKVKGVKP
jgi:hypothetical protein